MNLLPPVLAELDRPGGVRKVVELREDVLEHLGSDRRDLGEGAADPLDLVLAQPLDDLRRRLLPEAEEEDGRFLRSRELVCSAHGSGFLFVNPGSDDLGRPGVVFVDQIQRLVLEGGGFVVQGGGFGRRRRLQGGWRPPGYRLPAEAGSSPPGLRRTVC